MPISFKQQIALKSTKRAPVVNEVSAKLNKHIYIISGQNLTGTGNGSDSTVNLGFVPYANYKIVGWGFHVAVDGASGIAEKVQFGTGASDQGVSDLDLFGTFTQDTTAGKQWVSGDMFMTPLNIDDMVNPDAPANGGIHSWSAGNPDGIGVVQTKQSRLRMTKTNVAGSLSQVSGYVIIEAII